MKHVIRSSIFWAVLMFVLGAGPVFTEMLNAPAEMAAAMVCKVAAFEQHVSSVGDVTVYVMGDPTVARALEQCIGEKIGDSTLRRVRSGDGLPTETPTILFVGNPASMEKAIAYTRANKILSITGIPSLVTRGVTVGVGINEKGKPELVLNLSSTMAEGLEWSPALIKISQVIK